MKEKVILPIAVSAVLAAGTFTACSNAEAYYTPNALALKEALIEEAEVRIATEGESTSTIDVTGFPDVQTYLPQTFDLRAVDTDNDGETENYVTSVKQQRPFGTCWAFGTMAAAETSILYESGQEAVVINEEGEEEDAIDLSEHHLSWFAYTPVKSGSQKGEGLYSQVDGLEENESAKLSSGSTQFAASTVFASGIGPVLEPAFDTATGIEAQLNYHGKHYELKYNEKNKETYYSEDDDWSVDESNRFRLSYLLDEMLFLPSPLSYDEDGNYDIDYAQRVSDVYKEQIYNGKPVTIAYYADSYKPDQDNKAAQYINSDGGTWAHYCYEKLMCNHSVTIIGWDDNYSASNFLTEVQDRDSDGNLLYNEDGTPKMKSVDQPPADGAWIVKNSWGATDSIGQGLTTGDWGIDGSGYFYLSYYDQSLEGAYTFDFDVEGDLEELGDDYIIDQYDFMPCEVPHSVKTTFPVATANVFTASKNQTIRAVSCTTTQADEEVTFDIFLMNGSEYKKTNMKKIGTYTETFEYPGLHIVKLPETYDIPKGQKYAVAVTQETDDGYLFSVGSEWNQKGFDAGYCDDKYAANAVVNRGESFIYLTADDCWLDFSLVKSKLEKADGATSYITYDNFPIKVYSSVN